MNFSQYEEHIREQLQLVTVLHISNAQRSRSICEGLLAVGETRGDDALMGFAYYYLAESYFVDNQYPLFISNLILGLEHQLQASVPLLLAKSYNMLGISATYSGNASMGMDHYLTSLQYAEQGGLAYEQALANSNIGNIYREMGEPKTAITYLNKALIQFETCTPTQDRLRNLVTTCSSLAICYLDAGDSASALASFERQDKGQNKLYDYTRIAALSFEIRYCNTVGNLARRDAAIEELLSMVKSTVSLMGVYDELFALYGFLHKIGYFDQLWRLLCSMDALITQSGITHMMLKTMSYKIYYYQDKNMEDAYLTACTEHFALSRRLEEELRLSLKNDIRLREELEKIKGRQQQMQAEHKVLLEKSRRDFLTNLPNREWLNEYAEAAFDRALRHSTRIAVEILDIDNFKQYNDTLGHQAGDLYLQALSNLLCTLIDRGFFCARHGGDEFVIVYEDKSDAEIMSIAEQLRRNVMALCLTDENGHTYPAITISQGVCSAVPVTRQRLWDFFHEADQALYLAKNANRNTIRLTPLLPDGVLRCQAR